MSGILTLIYATHSGILTSPRSSKPRDSPSPHEERSPTMPRRNPDFPLPPLRSELTPKGRSRKAAVGSGLYLYIHGFGGRLKPRYIFRAGSLDQ